MRLRVKPCLQSVAFTFTAPPPPQDCLICKLLKTPFGCEHLQRPVLITAYLSFKQAIGLALAAHLWDRSLRGGMWTDPGDCNCKLTRDGSGQEPERARIRDVLLKIISICNLFMACLYDAKQWWNLFHIMVFIYLFKNC